jgi:hypothetical protein
MVAATSNLVRVAVSYTLSRIRDLRDAVKGRFVVSNASVLPEDSAKGIRVGVGSMAVCKHCKADTRVVTEDLVILPIKVTQNKLFRKKSAPTQVCPYCDGDVLSLAMSNFEKNSDRSK